jgi:glucose-1-phosphate cytidylyltransferase
MVKNQMEVHQSKAEPWRVTLVDTGEATLTGGRLLRVADHVQDGDFCFTYGDGVSDVDVSALVEHHRSQGAIATMTAVQPPGRFGAVDFEQDRIVGFHEKPQGDGGWINGGFFVLSPRVFDYLEGDDTVWERTPLERLAAERNLSAFLHRGFWHPMDTLRDKNYLEELWQANRAPWKVW